MQTSYSREEIIERNPLVPFLESRGVKLVGAGTIRTTNRCAAVEHKPAHLCVSVDTGRNLWNCNDCKAGGTVIDWIMQAEGATVGEAIAKLCGNGNGNGSHASPSSKGVLTKIYPYLDELGREVFQVCRFEPKTFRQRHGTEGAWVWSMEGVERKLYHLPEVLKAQSVWIVEGEKDADNLAALGFVATCNVGGAGKWLDAYTECLAGKDVILCGDNDKPGKDHVEKVFESLAGRVKSAKLLNLPTSIKDASDFILTFPTPEEAKKALGDMESASTAFVKGIKLSIYSMPELELRYQRQVRECATVALHLGKWLPTFNRLRPIIAGELVLLIGDTGTGKSALLQNIAAHAAPLPALFFELELPAELLYERFAAMLTGFTCAKIEQAYRTADELLGPQLDKLSHIHVCPESGLTLEQIESNILRAELKTGVRPRLVLLDYIQLVKGKGERYERTSDTAEGLKALAKSTQTIIILASQVARNKEQKEINIHSGKDSGSLENSAGLVLGAWRDDQDAKLMHLHVLKNTKGSGSGAIKVACNFDGETMRITERSPISPEDHPNRTQADP